MDWYTCVNPWLLFYLFFPHSQFYVKRPKYHINKNWTYIIMLLGRVTPVASRHPVFQAWILFTVNEAVVGGFDIQSSFASWSIINDSLTRLQYRSTTNGYEMSAFSLKIEYCRTFFSENFQKYFDLLVDSFPGTNSHVFLCIILAVFLNRTILVRRSYIPTLTSCVNYSRLFSFK